MTTTNALKYRLAQQRVADGLWSVDADLGVVRGQLGRPIGSRDRDGYTVLAIDHQGKTLRGIMAHRVIWEAVHGPIPDGLEINHIVGVRFGGSNAISNLEIVTRSENMAHAFRCGLHGAIGERHRCARLTRCQVREIRRTYAKGGVSQDELARQFGISQPSLSNVVRGVTWKHLTEGLDT